MRLALVAQNLVYGDGQGRINLEIARWALRAGHQVIIVAVEVDPRILELGANWEKVEVRRKPILARVALFPAKADKIIDRLRNENKIDFVIANGYTLTRRHDLNLCQFVHAAWLRSGVHGTATRGLIRRAYQSFYTRYNAHHEKRSYHAARIVVAPSLQTLGELRKMGIDPAKLRKIPNGVDCEEFSPAPPGPRERSELNLPYDFPIALFAGDVRTNRKGLGSVLNALITLPNVHLAIVGRSDGSPFISMAKKLGLTHRTHFLGFRKDVPRILRACDLFVFPSWYDPFGLVVTEALACGIPVVTTRCTGAGELLNDQCGTVVEDPGDIPAIAAAMAGWLTDPAKRQRAVPAGRAIAEANGWESMAKQYLELLTKPRLFSDAVRIESAPLTTHAIQAGL
jgi:glycosyltransferase involved in cell wall biosynthesis